MAEASELKFIVFAGVFLALFFLISGMYEGTLMGRDTDIDIAANANITQINESLRDWGFFNPIGPILDVVALFVDLFTFDLGPRFDSAGDPFIFGGLRLSTLMSIIFSYPVLLVFLWMIIKLLRGTS